MGSSPWCLERSSRSPRQGYEEGSGLNPEAGLLVCTWQLLRQSQSHLGIPMLADNTCWAIREEKGTMQKAGAKRKLCQQTSRAVLADTLVLDGQELMIQGNYVHQWRVVTIYLGHDMVLLVQAGFIRVVIS